MAGRERASLTSINLLSPSNFSHSLFPLLQHHQQHHFSLVFVLVSFHPLCVCACVQARVRVGARVSSGHFSSNVKCKGHSHHATVHYHSVAL